MMERKTRSAGWLGDLFEPFEQQRASGRAPQLFRAASSSSPSMGGASGDDWLVPRNVMTTFLRNHN